MVTNLIQMEAAGIVAVADGTVTSGRVLETLAKQFAGMEGAIVVYAERHREFMLGIAKEILESEGYTVSRGSTG